MKQNPLTLTPDARRSLVDKALFEEYGHTDLFFEEMSGKQIVVFAGGHRFVLAPFPSAAGEWLGYREMPAGRGLTATSKVSLLVPLAEVPG